MPRVLIVDDDAAIRETLSVVLADAGYETLEAKNGAVALDVLLHSPERLVVVLDLVMPGLSGFGVLTRLAFDKHLATHHGFIVCTAAADSPERIGPHFTGLLQRLHIPFLARPFDIDALLQVIADSSHRLQESAERGEDGEKDAVDRDRSV